MQHQAENIDDSMMVSVKGMWLGRLLYCLKLAKLYAHCAGGLMLTEHIQDVQDTPDYTVRVMLRHDSIEVPTIRHTDSVF